MGISYDDLSERLPSPSVIAAVEKASSSAGTVIASDVSNLAGIPLSQARKDLTTLASLTRGDIAVSSDGELMYSFPKGGKIQSLLSSNSLKYRVTSALRKIWPGLFYVIRVSFGVALLVSIFAIFSTIALIQSSSSSRDDDRGGGRGGGGGGMFGYGFWGPSPFDFFYYRPYGYYYNTPYRDPEEMGFLESVFSYIFGDGDPNARLEEERLSSATSMIRENGGAVTAEQLAPFLDSFPAEEESGTGYVDESFVLPIVTQLDGEPVVTEEGDIIYVFPDLQVSTGAVDESMVLRKAGLEGDVSTRELKAVLEYNGLNTRGALDRADLISILREEVGREGSLDGMIQEQQYQFSLASDFNKFAAAALGVVNFGGALYLGNLLSSAALYGIRLPSYYGVVQSAYPFLLAYAVLFNAIPVFRNFYIQAENKKIVERNSKRRMWLTKVKTAVGGSRLAKKLSSAKKLGTKMKRLGGKDVVYDTKMTSEQMKDTKDKELLTEFDKLLKEDESWG